MNKLLCLCRWRILRPTMEPTSRLFLCARCRKQVIICRRCDRGQIYCAEGCASIARRLSVREAGRRYQQSRHGRFKQADRLRRFRLRKQNVTHQGSSSTTGNDLLTVNSAKGDKPVVWLGQSQSANNPQCHFCGVSCSNYVRNSFLHRRRVPNINRIGTNDDPFS